MTTDRSGHCLCGAVSLRLDGIGHEIHACHCGMCRRWTGSAFLTVTVAESALTVEGTEHVKRRRSSDWAERAFCGECGSMLWYRLMLPDAPPQYFVAAGLLDDLSGLRLSDEIYIDCKPQAWSFAGPTHQMTEAEVLAAFQASPEE
ncbi:GFA family protein [Cereibacter changlensis]|jgi:hypothetical protein|uniref:GFA family protein n=1 Tax=Cereibacter changlensis TaxID=402884 RepID=A0A4U0YWY0_9RHOB|nr:GFA family protein [Cereibacter changlensis]TKA97300.1 GFA family protein [Cereibacter changlensis]